MVPIDVYDNLLDILVGGCFLIDGVVNIYVLSKVGDFKETYLKQNLRRL